jgi:trehalose synthase
VGARVVRRCHIGRERPNDLTLVGWDFLRPYLAHADSLVFSRREYAPEWVDEDQMVVIPPSIDPFAVKNMPLRPEVVTATLARVGMVADGGRPGPVEFIRRDGGAGTVRAHRSSGGLLHAGDPPPIDVPLVVQVSRWDRLKDMAGVMEGFVRAAASNDLAGAHLMLAGPEVSGVSDDPEGAEVLGECQDQWQRLPQGVRGRVHLASIPMDDADENALIVNALQRHAAVVVQKSLVEGFGLTVTEAMWKARPVVASRLGGIQDQIADGRDGLLVDDPYDLDELAGGMRRPLEDAGLAARLGAAAHARVLSEFLGDRHLEQYVDLFSWLVSAPRPD